MVHVRGEVGGSDPQLASYGSMLVLQTFTNFTFLITASETQHVVVAPVLCCC
jgi:hypothetical protein